MIYKVNPYKMGSTSGKNLARALNLLRITPNFRRKQRHSIINWGNPHNTNVGYNINKDLNNPSIIRIASNKLLTFQHLRDKDYLPIWVTNKEDASALFLEHNKIYCRTLLTSHSGSGIVIAESASQLVQAPLYTAAAKHKDEYRIHVFQGKVIDAQKKKRKLDIIDRDAAGIRNLANGWIYARSDVVIPTVVILAAVDAVRSLGLDFGAVDIGHNVRLNKAILFEINTAPGLFGTTLEKYKEVFTKYMREN